MDKWIYVYKCICIYMYVCYMFMYMHIQYFFSSLDKSFLRRRNSFICKLIFRYYIYILHYHKYTSLFIINIDIVQNV